MWPLVWPVSVTVVWCHVTDLVVGLCPGVAGHWCGLSLWQWSGVMCHVTDLVVGLCPGVASHWCGLSLWQWSGVMCHVTDLVVGLCPALLNTGALCVREPWESVYHLLKIKMVIIMMMMMIIIIIMIVTVMIITIMIIISRWRRITLKGAIQGFWLLFLSLSGFFFTISWLCCELSPTHTVKWPGWECTQLTCSTSGAYHVQHVVQHIQSNGQVGNVCNSHAACQVLIMCSMLCATWYKGTALDRVEITFILALCHWLNPLTAEGEEETRVPREHPQRWPSENAAY